MTPAARDQAARWLAEAFETGNPLAPLPPEIAPRSVTDGQRIAALVVDRLSLVPCGVRVVLNGGGKSIAGPMLEGRLLQSGTTLALAALPLPRATAAIVAILAEDLPRRGGDLPRLAGVHPAIDVAASRFIDPPGSGALLSADLAGLGQVVVGKSGRMPEGEVLVTLALTRRRPLGVPHSLLGVLDSAAEIARRLGGLPAGAALVVAGLSPSLLPEAGLAFTASLGTLGRVTAEFA